MNDKILLSQNHIRIKPNMLQEYQTISLADKLSN